MASLVQVANRIDSLTVERTGVRRLATVYVPSDETCLHLFDADSAGQVARVCATAEVEIDLINPAIYFAGHDPSPQLPSDLSLEPPPRRTP